jgi:hypothetical protein
MRRRQEKRMQRATSASRKRMAGIAIMTVAAAAVAGIVTHAIVRDRQRLAREAEFYEELQVTGNCLRSYHSAQTQFRRTPFYGDEGGLVYANTKHGEGFPDLYEVGGPGSGGPLLKLIFRRFAEAGPGGDVVLGYHFIDIVGDGRGTYDYSRQHGLCAFPASYRRSGAHTLVTDVTGAVYCKDTGGEPVTVFPDVEAEGWVRLHPVDD